MAGREYSIFRNTFWTGETGRLLREAGRDAQLMAAYLFTCQASNMIGLYYLPLPLLCHELGYEGARGLEGASKVLRRVCDTGFARWDSASEHVFVPEMAAQQVGEPLDEKDNRVKGIVKEWQSMRKSPFYMDFHARYAKSFHLPEPSPLEAPSKPLRSQEQEQDQEQKQEQDQDQEEGSGSADADACPAALARLIELWNAIPGVLKCKYPTKKRIAAFRQRSTDKTWLNSVKEALEKLKASDFCLGNNDRGWVADLDWFLKPDSVAHLIEGRYETRPGKVKTAKNAAVLQRFLEKSHAETE